MKKIPLSKGMSALVDDADYKWLSQWKWSAVTASGKHYAVRNAYSVYGKNKIISMHRIIMRTPQDLDTDHIDGDGLNNQRGNLRICTRAENMRNKRKPKTNDEPYIGIKKYSGILKTTWRAIIGHDGTTEHLGQFKTPEAAARAYDEAARKYFGEFAHLNFPNDS